MIQVQSIDYSIYPTKMSRRNQTVVPAKVRKALGIKGGGKLFWRLFRINDEVKAIAEAKPANWAKYTRGLGKHIWKGVDIDKYINDLREEW